jgi:hypothetical protein
MNISTAITAMHGVTSFGGVTLANLMIRFLPRHYIKEVY